MPDDEFEDALSALTHEIRVAVLRELADADEPVAFSELRDRVGVRDPGKFNYHLQRLTDHFLRQTEDGYELGYRGRRLLVDNGVDADAVTLGSADETRACPVCGELDCDRLIHVHLGSPAPW
ncbi:MAG: hypothetical protein J07HB67_00433 [halophilic archaeon J07HB67]|nr:MAG: hypothetical protein J07HB67_00433 [halophilic archaeon J07HB67]